MTLDEVETVLHRLFSIIESVDAFDIAGGEPLLHPDLATILKIVDKYSNQINRTIDITTNGTLEMTDETVDFFRARKDRTRVIISDYGKYSPKARLLAEKLSSLGINVRVDRHYGDSPIYGGWIDDRDLSLKFFTQREIDEHGKNCFYREKGWPIRKGELHNCSRGYWRMLKKVIPRNPVRGVQ